MTDHKTNDDRDPKRLALVGMVDQRAAEMPLYMGEGFGQIEAIELTGRYVMALFEKGKM